MVGPVEVASSRLRAGIVLLWVALVVGCSSARTVVEVEMVEGAWMVSPSTVLDEEVTVLFANVGAERHLPVSVLSDLPPGDLPVVDDVVDLRRMPIRWPLSGGEWSRAVDPQDVREGLEPGLEPLEPGATFEALGRKPGEGDPGLGQYVVLCYLPGHYERGEFGVFHIESNGS